MPRRLAQSRWARIAAGIALLALIALWLAPRRVAEVVPLDGGARWSAEVAPPRRHVVWQPAREMDELPAIRTEEGDESRGGRITPHLADGGMTLLFAARDATGQSDLYESHRTPRGWSRPEPLAGVNTPSDELGPAVSRDGRELFFFSNRPGGLGGVDLYVAARTDDGWSEPRNLGPAVNTPANEYDPALSPDGKTLYFSSNRTRAMQDAAEQRTSEDHEPAAGDAWSTTLRAAPGETTFDLYAARRESPDDAWGPPRGLAAINRPDSNEGAPFVSPDGAFLYFASDRPARPGEPANLDLYRIRLRGEAVEPENLGPTINTAAHETEPTLSPEGHALVFSTNRDGDDRLYQSLTQEVEERSGWNVAHLKLGSVRRWIAFLLVLTACSALCLAIYYRSRLLELVWPARFFAASVLVHLVIMIVLLFMRMPDAMQRLADYLDEEEVRDPLLLDIEQAPPREIIPAPLPPAPLPKVADLAPSEPAAAPAPARESAVPVLPRQTARPLPAMTIESSPPVAVRAPAAAPDRPQPEPDARPAAPPLARRTGGMRAAAIDDLPDVPKAAPVERPAETEFRPEATLAREKPATPGSAPAALPRVTAAARGPAAMPRDDVGPPASQPEAPTVASVSGVPAASRGTPKTAPAALDRGEEIALPAAKPSAAPAMADDRAAPTVARAPASLSAPQPAPAGSATSELPRSGSPRRDVALPAAGLGDPAGGAADPSPRVVAALPGGAARDRSRIRATGATIVEEVPETPAVLVGAAKEMPLTEAVVARTQTVGPRPGFGGLPEPSRPGDRPAATPREVARVEAPPVPGAAPGASAGPGSAASPFGARQAAPAKARGLAALDESTELLVAAAPGVRADAKGGDALASVSVARTAEEGTRPVGGGGGPATSAPSPKAVAGDPGQARPAAGLDLEAGAGAAGPRGVAAPLSRAMAGPARPSRAASLDEDVAEVVTTLRPAASVSGTGDLAATSPDGGRAATALRPTFSIGLSPDAMGPPAGRAVPAPGGPGGGGAAGGGPAGRSGDGEPSLALSPLAGLARAPARGSRVAIVDDGPGLRSLFTMRQSDERRQYIDRVGGTAESEKAVQTGLAWLKSTQEKDGSWSLVKHGGGIESLDGATGLALLPFLAAGHTHKSGEHRETVAAGVKWLVDHQQPDGALFPAGAHRPMYGHGIASIALCEAYGMTGDAALREPAAKALAFIARAQHAASGGWRYLPNESADTSVVGWQVMALKSGEMAGIPAPKPVLDNAARWLASVESNKPVGGQFGYLAPVATPAMTAEGLLCLQFLGTGRNDPRMRAGAEFLMLNLPRPAGPGQTSYYWYYATQVMYHMQGSYWEAWNAPLRDALVKTQVAAGANAGAWDPLDAYELRAGRLYATSLKLLTLEVYYRHLPLYEQLGE